jgi:hypothetical protein
MFGGTRQKSTQPPMKSQASPAAAIMKEADFRRRRK